jgi:ABC-type dipeptide/oligopeptide/nickel transport system permease subunit
VKALGRRGLLDGILMRFDDALRCIPLIFIVIYLSAVFHSSLGC